MQRRSLVFLSAATLAFVLAGASSALAVTPQNVYRFYNLSNDTHFYTASDAERLSVARTLYATYRYDGIAYTMDAASPALTQTLYRFYKYTNGSHFYTASEAEKAYIIANFPTIYRLDGPAWSVSPTPVAGGVTVYRFYRYSTDSHFYTASEAEKNYIIATWPTLYRYEGPAFYSSTAPQAPVWDDDRYSAEMMTEWVNYYRLLVPDLGDLWTTDDVVDGLRDGIVSDPSTNWVSKYRWGNSDAWELDWRSSSLGGNDYRLADDVDLAAFCGHGLGLNFVLNNKNNDNYATVWDMQLGDRDCEWLLAFTCNFLKQGSDPANWGCACNGLHLICGYATDMTITSNAGSAFASWAKPSSTHQAYGVRVAWYKYGQTTQDGADANIARTFGASASMNDYLWGYGAVSPDPPPYSASPSSYSYRDTKLNF